MSEQTEPARSKPRPVRDDDGVPFGSNAIRLTGRQWLAAVAIVLVCLVVVPGIWARMERFERGPDERMPYQLGNDYWLYSQACRIEAARDRTLVVGDSVVWGQYVAKDQTLGHYLNALAGEERFANLGLDGSHPAALAGLLQYYGRDVADRRVLLQYNPLWMTSRKHDLQTDKEFRFNHPRLVPQFVPSLPCYTATTAERLSIVMERYVPLLSWSNHLRMTYFDNRSLPSWTMDRPYDNPAGAITMRVPPSTKKAGQRPMPWTRRGMDRADFDWVGLDTSFQWRSFQQTVGMLRDRDNDVFVLVGPFNEHMLLGRSVETYAALKRGFGEWLRSEGVPHLIPPVLPSELYADASHPLSDGYALIAKQLHACEAFAAFDGRR